MTDADLIESRPGMCGGYQLALKDRDGEGSFIVAHGTGIDDMPVCIRLDDGEGASACMLISKEQARAIAIMLMRVANEERPS